MQYRTTKCPHCGKYLEFLKKTGWNDLEASIGCPTGFCIHCKNTHRTGRNYWHKMDSTEKFNVWLRVLFGSIIGGFVVGMFLFFMFSGLNSLFNLKPTNSTYSKAVLFCMPLGVLISTFLHFHQLQRLIKTNLDKN